MKLRMGVLGALFLATGLVVSVAPRYSPAWWGMLMIHYAAAAGGVAVVFKWARAVEVRVQELESKLAAITEECRAELDETGQEEGVVVALRA